MQSNNKQQPVIVTKLWLLLTYGDAFDLMGGNLLGRIFLINEKKEIMGVRIPAPDPNLFTLDLLYSQKTPDCQIFIKETPKRVVITQRTLTEALTRRAAKFFFNEIHYEFLINIED